MISSLAQNILTLDLGASTGWALKILGRGKIRYGCKTFGGSRVERTGAFMGWLEGVIAGGKIDLIAYERPFARGHDATRSLWGMAGITEAVAQTFGVTVTDHQNATVRKWFTGSGKASKRQTMEELSVLGYHPTTDDEADALALLLYVLEHLEE